MINLILELLHLRNKKITTFSALRDHGSRMSLSRVLKYTSYWKKCQIKYANKDKPHFFSKEVKHFNKNRWVSFDTSKTRELAQALFEKVTRDEKSNPTYWKNQDTGYWVYDGLSWYRRYSEIDKLFQGELGLLIREIFRSEFKIWRMHPNKSARLNDCPRGSQNWHTDSGPGTCINVIFFFNDVSEKSGPLQLIPLDITLKLAKQETDVIGEAVRRFPDWKQSKIQNRKIRKDFYTQEIEQKYKNHILTMTGKAGKVILFNNNLIHRGALPDLGKERYALITHVYPSCVPTPFEYYRKNGIPELGPIPVEPKDGECTI